ncbi:MAG TPA: hypothetical protein VFI42_08115 [Thermomicrobiaceae bacterium]|nr:hypothetical protein [Thermomicrobiaceae bacterium]
MYTSIHRYGELSASPEDMTHAIRELAVALSKLPGFITYLALDCGAGACGTIAIFDDHESLALADRLAARWVSDRLGSRSLETPLLASGEIIAQRGL